MHIYVAWFAVLDSLLKLIPHLLSQSVKHHRVMNDKLCNMLISFKVICRVCMPPANGRPCHPPHPKPGRSLIADGADDLTYSFRAAYWPGNDALGEYAKREWCGD